MAELPDLSEMGLVVVSDATCFPHRLVGAASNVLICRSWRAPTRLPLPGSLVDVLVARGNRSVCRPVWTVAKARSKGTLLAV